MNRKLGKPDCRVLIRLVAAVISAVGLNLAWSTSAQAAGNMELRLENGELLIAGDDRDNNIIVIQECCQKIVVTGRAETTINGSAGRFDVEGVTHDVLINMNGGDDFVRVEVVPGFSGFPTDLQMKMGRGNDLIELLGVTVKDDTRIDTGDGNDIIFIDGVLGPTGFNRPDFRGKFALDSGSGDDLLEFHHAIFRGEVNVSLGSGVDGACNTEDSEFQRPDQARFDGGPSGGDGFVAPIIQLPHITNFEDFPDDCSFLGGRD